MARTESIKQIQKGNKAPYFSLPGIDGEIYTLKSLMEEKGIFIIFMCNHCPYVRAKMKEIVELYKEFRESIGFIGINSSDPEYPGEGIEKMKSFAKEWEMEFPYLIDEYGEVAKKYGASCTPDPFLFNKEGELVFHGRINNVQEPSDEVTEHTMKENLQKLLNGEEIDPWFNPSVGCSIKFKSSPK